MKFVKNEESQPLIELGRTCENGQPCRLGIHIGDQDLNAVRVELIEVSQALPHTLRRPQSSSSVLGMILGLEMGS